MTIAIETKFNVGDAVYVADHYFDYYPVQTPYVINDILINISNRGTRIMYCVEHDDTTDRFPEDWLFSTYEECTKWCDEQNKKFG